MAKGEAKFELSIGALDKFTKPFNGFADKVDKATAGVRKFGRESAVTKGIIGQALGFPKLSSALSGMGKAFGGLSAGLDKTLGNLGSVAKGFGLIGLVSGGAGAGLFTLVKGFADAGDAAVKMAQKAGVSVTGWQEWNYAASMSGVESERLRESFNKLNANAVKAAKGGKEQAAAFKNLGVSLKNSKGQLKDSDTLMMEVADALSKMPEGAKKAAAANAVFGESGAQLLPLLNGGKDGLMNLRREAVNFGVVIGEDAARASETFNDNLSRLGFAAQGLGFDLAGKLMPVVNDVVTSVTGWIGANREVINSKITEWVEKLSAALPEIKAKVGEFVEAIPGYLEGINEFVDSIGGWETVAIAAAAVIAGPLLSGILGLIPPIISLGAAILATPIGWVLAAGAAIVGIGVAIYKNWDKIVGFFTGKFNKVKEAFSGNWLKGIWTAIKEFSPIGLIADMVNGIVKHFTGVDLGAVVGGWFDKVCDSLGTVGSKIWSALSSTLGGFIENVAGFFKSKVARVTEAFDQGWIPGILAIFQEFNPAALLADFVNNIINYFFGVDLFEIGDKWLKGVWDGFKAGWAAFADWVTKGIKDLIPDFVLDMLADDASPEEKAAQGQKTLDMAANSSYLGGAGGGPGITGGLTHQGLVQATQRVESYEEKVSKVQLVLPPGVSASVAGGPAEGVSVNYAPSYVGLQGR